MESAIPTRPRPGSTLLAPLRDRRLSWAAAGFGALCIAAVVGYFAFPTYPTYDSFYALLWGRDLLHLHLPDFHVYRGPTEHPLAIAFGAFCSIFGEGGARLMVLGAIASFVAAVAGLYRLGRLCFGPVVGVIAALLLLSRFFVENLAAQGYLDISYIALIVWAIALEVQRPRRGGAVLVLLALAGLLRPDAWVLSGAYWLWCLPGTSNGLRAKRLAIVDLGAADLGLPGRDRHRQPALLAHGHGRPRRRNSNARRGPSSVVSSMWTFTERIDKLPVMLGALAGILAAVWIAPRRALVPLAATALLYLVFLAEGVVGASVIDRYMLGGATVLLLFCAVFLGGWWMLESGWLRRVWITGAVALLAFGAASAATTLNLQTLSNTLAYKNEFHTGLASALRDPKVAAQIKRCKLVSLPNNKLIPDARWILHSTNQHDIVARSQARADAAKGSHTLSERIRRGSVAVYPLGSSIFYVAIVDVGDDPRDQVPLQGFKRIYTSRYYAVYGNC